MKKGLIITIISLFSIILLCLCVVPLVENHLENTRNSNSVITNVDDINSQYTGISELEGLGSFRKTAYYNTYNTWKQTYEVVDLSSPLVSSLDATTKINNPGITFQEEDSVITAKLNKNESLIINVAAPQTGLYELGLNFKPNENFTNSPSVGILVNGETPFNEISNINLEVSWSLQERTEDKKYNRYGNELLPYSVADNKWYTHYFNDINSRYLNPYKVLLNEGNNTITITNYSDPILVKEFYLNNTKQIGNYEAYLQNHSDKEIVNELVTIDAEKIAYKNDIEIKASYYKDPGMTPNAYKNTVLNILDGGSTSRGGSKATYTFTVEKSGLYSISFKYLQNSLNGLTVAKTIYVDGEIPYKEFEVYQFPETTKWTNHTLNYEGKPYYVYLEAGKTHTLAIETTTAHYNAYIEELYMLMDEINNLGLTITSYTASSSNQYTDWDILELLPTIKEDLSSYADRIDKVYDEINKFSPSSSEASEISTLKIASKQLRRLTKDPNKIHLKLSELNSGSGSAYQLIGNAIGTLLSQPMSIDSIYLAGEDVDLPKARSNFFVKTWFQIKSFIFSFFDERYKVEADNNDDTLEVWVAQSNLYLDIIQSMVDDEFTRETGIDVKISILPSSQKIILNNATGTNPDVVLSIDSWEPYNYALRGMLEDLSGYDGFDEVTKNIYSNCFTPVIYDEGVYAIPETTGLNVLFYRKDILEYLDLECPRSWDDVIKILPILQSYQMNFYHPLGADSSYKNYGATTPFIYSYGGEVFSDNGMTTVLNQEEVIQAIQFMTDLFNIYNLPRQVASFFEHFRSGTLPIGVGTLDMYLQLKYASPELAGQWGIVPVPGFDTDNDGEVESWTTAYGKASLMFASSNMKEEGWEFIKWWNETETQIAYSQNIKMCLGERYLIIPANIDALEASPWDQEIKNAVKHAAKYSRIPAITPGSYAVERELSNIWNKVVIDLVDVRVAVGEGIDTVNHELQRKYEEFGYIKDGEIVKDYVVPNNSNIWNWVKGRDYYEQN